VDKAKSVDYKDTTKLGRYISDRGRIEPRRRSGACAKHQRMVCEAIKRARHLAMLPYTAGHVHNSGGVGIIERPPRPRFDRRPRFNQEAAPMAAAPAVAIPAANIPAAPAVAAPATAPAPADTANQGKV
jgi:small subunit ribosomal protein S18